MTDCTAINTGAVGDRITITEDGAYIVLAGVQTTLDLTAAANSGLGLLPTHATIQVTATSPQVLLTTFRKAGPTFQSGDNKYTKEPNKNASWTVYQNTSSASTIANIISGLATFETTYMGHA